MKAALFAVGLNEMLGFVRRYPSVSPDLSTFDSIIQMPRRRMAIQFLLASTFDIGARLTMFKQH
jgi:hypothetical protein